METKKDNLIHASIAARKYGLPLKWLKDQARSGAIPALIADNQILFDHDILANWLTARARGNTASENQAFTAKDRQNDRQTLTDAKRSE